MKSITRAISDGLPYVRVALPSGRAVVLRAFRASFGLRKLQTVQAIAEHAREAFAALDGLSGADRIGAQAEALEAAEAAVGYMIGSTWADPDWSLESWDAPATLGNPIAIGAAVVAELDEAGYSSADIAALGRVARCLLTFPEAPDLLDRVRASLADKEVAPDSSAARIADEVNEQADFSDAPRE